MPRGACSARAMPSASEPGRGRGRGADLAAAAVLLALLPARAAAHDPLAAIQAAAIVALVAVAVTALSKRRLAGAPRAPWWRLALLAVADLGLAFLLTAAMFTAWQAGWVAAAGAALAASVALHVALLGRVPGRTLRAGFLALAGPLLFAGLVALGWMPLYAALGG